MDWENLVADGGVHDGSIALDNGLAGGGVSVSVKSAMSFLVRGWWVVALACLVGALFGLGMSWVSTPIYQSSATLYVTAGADANTQSAYQGSLASEQRVASYTQLATSDAVLTRALSQSGLGISPERARAMVRATAERDTVLLRISAESPDSWEAVRLVGAIGTAMTEFVETLEQPSGGGAPLAKLTVITPATVSAEPVSPKTTRNCLYGGVLGVICGFVLVFLRERTDTRLRSTSDVMAVGSAAVLGEVPRAKELERHGVLNFGGGASAAAEVFRKIRTNLTFLNVDSPARRLVVTSCNKGEGKTTTVLNLAAALSEAGNSVVLVDADLRDPSVARALAMNGSVGLTNFLRGDVDVDALVQATQLSRFDVIASGELPPNPAELLGSKRFGALLEILSDRYDFVLIDVPPVLPVTDAVVVSQWTDGALFVVRGGRTKSPDLASAVRQIRTVNVDLLGFVMNDVERSEDLYKYGGYGSDDHLVSADSGGGHSLGSDSSA